MRVQITHQTVLQKGMPKEIAILLSSEELMLLQQAIINAPEDISDGLNSFCAELNGHICNAIDIEHNSDKGEL